MNTPSEPTVLGGEGPLKGLLLQPQNAARLGITPTLDNGTLVLALSGNGEIPDQSALAMLLLRTHEVAREQKVSAVHVDMNGLKFMNSSCFKAFVTWLAALSGTEPASERYKVHFLLNPTRRWQRVSVSALCCFAVDLITFS